MPVVRPCMSTAASHVASTITNKKSNWPTFAGFISLDGCAPILYTVAWLHFFTHTFLRPRTSGSLCSKLPTSCGLGGGCWCLQPACISQQLVQSGRVTSSTELSGGRKLKERSGEGSLRGNPPAVHPSGLSRAAHGGSAGCREKYFQQTIDNIRCALTADSGLSQDQNLHDHLQT